VEEFSQRTGRLEGELDSERQRTVQLGTELQAAQEHESCLQAHAQWLQSEWDAAKAQINELNQSSHHWWSMADRLNRELQHVYANKSWRIALPLRWAFCLPKRMVKLLVVWAMRQALANPGLKACALSMLAKLPQLRQRLRQFAMRSVLIAGDSMISPISHPFSLGSGAGNTAARTYLPNISEESIGKLLPRAARIYADLQKAIEMRKS